MWDEPARFDPDRFLPERARHYHRYAYFPFGGGPHQCIGRHIFNVEAQLILTSILSRFRPGCRRRCRPSRRSGPPCDRGNPSR